MTLQTIHTNQLFVLAASLVLYTKQSYFKNSKSNTSFINLILVVWAMETLQ